MAVSLEASLFDRVDALAREMKVPRSRVFALAVEEYLRRREVQSLLERINAAYGDGPDDEERAFIAASRRRLRRVAEEEPD